ncbi:MAG: hypothetical protein ACK2U9_26300, partial [Anaerolineae bacterium]
IAVVILIVLIGIVVGVDAIRRATSGGGKTAAGEPTLVPGGVPIRLDGRLVGSFTPGDLEGLEEASFVDAEEGKTQDGWLLKEVLLRHVDPGDLQADSTITIRSSSRDKTATVTWAETEDEDNYVMFDLSNQGTLKLVSVLDKLDTRDEWVQVVDSIEITSP